jgi:hypothetical protein
MMDDELEYLGNFVITPNLLTIAAHNDEKEDFTSDGRNDAYTITSSFSAVNNSMAFTDAVQLLCSDSSYVTNSDRDQRSERLRLELNQLEGDESPRNTTNSTIYCTPPSVMAHPVSFQQSLPVVPPSALFSCFNLNINWFSSSLDFCLWEYSALSLMD